MDSIYFKNDFLTLHFGDFRNVLPTIAGGSIDCIITDPAYWTLDKHRSVGTTTRLGGHRDEDKRSGWFDTISEEDLYFLLNECYRLLPKNGHTWMFADNEVQAVIQTAVLKKICDFNYVKSFPVIKRTKDGLGVRQGMGYHGRCSHEYVVLCEKGRRRFNNENFPDFFEIEWIGDAESKIHTPNRKPYPTAKPTKLYHELLRQSTSEGETVLDMFAGSGTLADVILTMRTGRKAVCVDKSEFSKETMLNRVGLATHNLFAAVQ